MAVLSQKLKLLKIRLKDWNKNVFGDVHQQVKSAMTLVDEIQNQISIQGNTDELVSKEKDAQIALQQVLAYEEDFWQEKSRIDWHINGERNTEFFHKMANIRFVTKHISVMKKDDQLLVNIEETESHVLDYYMNLFATNNNCDSFNIVNDVIPSLVLDDDNTLLTSLPTMEEVKQAVFDLNGNSAPGPDGFGGFFYHKYWEIIASNVYAATLQFFKHGWIMPNLNSNIVVLVPKVSGADRIELFRPIALANFQFKIITKVLASRLALVAPKIISPN